MKKRVMLLNIISAIIVASVIFNIVTGIIYKKKIKQSKYNIRKLINNIRKLKDD